LLIQTRAPVFRSQSPIQSPCGSSPLPLSLSKTTLKTLRMKEECYGVYWVLNRVLIHHIIKAKSSKNRRKTKSCAKKGKIQSTTGTHGRATRRTAVCPSTTGRAPHHGHPMVATVLPGPFASRMTRFGFLWTLIWALDLHVLGLLQLCLIYVLQPYLAWIQLIHFS